MSYRGPGLILAGAECVWDDVDALENELLGGEPWPGMVLVVNDMGYKEGHNGRRWDRPVDHWCTLHAEKLSGWMRQRRNAGLGTRGLTTWSSVRRSIVDMNHRGWTDGSSGLYAVGVALQALRLSRVVLCGMPMDRRVNTFSERDWTAFNRYQRNWPKYDGSLRGRVKSMSGWTRQRYGAPTRDWLGLIPRLERAVSVG